MTLLIAIVISLAVGGAAGFVLRRRSDRWCSACGAQLRCIPCTVKAQKAHDEAAQPQPGCR